MQVVDKYGNTFGQGHLIITSKSGKSKLPVVTVAWGNITGALIDQTDLQDALNLKVPTARTITINGVAQDLSADRTWTISTGITVNTTPITGGVSGRLLFDNAGTVGETSGINWNSSTATLSLLDSPFYSQAGNSSTNTAFSITGTASSNYTIYSSRQFIFNTGQSMYFNTDTDGGSALDRAWYFAGARTGITGGRTYGALTVDSSGFPSFTLYNNDNGARILLASNATSYFNGGNLLVGTTTDAGFKLDVIGSTRVTSLKTADIFPASASISLWTNSLNASSRFYTAPVHQDGRISFNAIAGSSDYAIIRAWHTGSFGLGTGSSATNAALTVRGDTLLVGPSGALYFMNGTFGPNNVPYRLAISTTATTTSFYSGVGNNLTNIESTKFEYTAVSHTFYTGTTAGNQANPNQYTPLHLSNLGNVTIGSTTDAGYKLDVNGNTRSNRYYATDGINLSRISFEGFNNVSGIQYSSPGGLASISFFLSTGNYLTAIYNGDTVIAPVRNDINNLGDVVIQGGGSERARFKANGNVGIATSNPSYKLHTVGSTGFDNGASGDAITILNSGYIQSGLIRFRGFATQFIIQDNSYNTKFAISTSGSFSYFNTGGNVGINTTTDSGYTLNVNGTGYFNGRVDLSANSPLTSGGGGNNQAGVSLWGTQNGANGYDGWVGRNLEYNGTNYLYKTTDANNYWGTVAGIRTLGTGNLALGFIARPATGEGSNVIATDLNTYTRLAILYNGNVGIGTTTPTTSLDVNGTIKALYVNTPMVYGSGDLDLAAAGGTTGILIKSATRNVLINTTVDSGYKLDVAGTVRVKGNSLTLSPTGLSTPPANYVAINFDETPNHHQNWFAINSKKDISGIGTSYDRIIFPTMGNDNSTWEFNALGTYSRIRISARNNASGNFLDLTNTSISFSGPWTVSTIDRTNRQLVFGNMSTDVHHLSVYDLVIKGAQPFENNSGNSNGGNVFIVGGTPSTVPAGNYGNVVLAHDRTATRGNVLVGTSTNVISSKLTVESTTQGFLPPRMSNAQMLAIGTPAEGLMVYDTTNRKLCCYDGATWQNLF